MPKIPSPNLWTKTLRNPPLDEILSLAEYEASLGAMTLLPPWALLEFTTRAEGPLAELMPYVLDTIAEREVYGPSLFYGMEN